MSLLAPWMFVAGVAAALGVVALHLLSTRRPPVAVLPTARFVPESDVRAVARTSKPTDLLLLALRTLALLLIGLGFAQPLPNAPGPRVRSVVALEWTTALLDVEAARRAALERLADGDALVLFDTAARQMDPAALEREPHPTVRRAAFSPMYAAAQAAARTIARGADSLRFVVLSARPADAVDAATSALRATWPGRVEPVALIAQADTARSPSPQLLPLDATDPLAPALRALPVARGAHRVRVQRGALDASDSVWLNESPGAVLIHWPRQARDRVSADAVTMFDAQGGTLVAPLSRMARSEGRVMARWRDGAPAITESQIGSSCIRSVGVGLPEAGDLTLRAPFRRFLESLVAACGGRRDVALADSQLVTVADAGPLASAADFIGEANERSILTPWLLAAALLLLIAEQILRRRQRAEAA